MIRHAHRSRPWFGAVAVLLLLALPVQADDVEPEPYADESPEPAPHVGDDPAPAPEPARQVEPKRAVPTKAASAAREGPSVGEKIFDCAVLRPLGFVATLVGGAFFVPAAALASGVVFVPPMALNLERVNEGVGAAWTHFVAAPADSTFKRPLGDF